MADYPKELRFYIAPNRSVPAEEWLMNLRDLKAKIIIETRLDRLSHGNPGDHRFVGSGVWELRFHIGPGYRLYYAEDGGEFIILLLGGDKSSQRKDIQKARLYWADYRSRP